MGGKFLPRNTEKVSLDILLKSNNIQVVKEMILTYDALFIANNTLTLIQIQAALPKFSSHRCGCFRFCLRAVGGNVILKKV